MGSRTGEQWRFNVTHADQPDKDGIFGFS